MTATEVEITAIAAGGDGVGRLADGRAVFVPRTAPGDRIALRGDRLRMHRHFARGESEIAAGPVLELGHAIVALLEGDLPVAPAGMVWLFGTSTGRRAIALENGAGAIKAP